MEQQHNKSIRIIDAVESIIAQGRTAQKIGEPIEWHQQASAPYSQLSPVVLTTEGQSILSEIPYADVESSIHDTKDGDPDALVRMRRARRLFIAARDSIMFGMNQELPAVFDPIFILCRSLGKVADTNGEDRSAIKTSLKSLDAVSSLESHGGELIPPTQLPSRIRQHLHTSELTSHSVVRNATHDQYHSWRKDFRRVVHAYMVHAAATGTQAEAMFAARGSALNSYYGRINDRLEGRRT